MSSPVTQANALPTFADVQSAAKRLHGVAHRTPVESCKTLNNLAGRDLFFKCEHKQKVGAFKFRGASNAVMQLSDDEAAHGVVTHSSGNHAQALALAAKTRGIPAFIVMPKNAPRIKREAVKGYGAKIIDCEPNQVDREATAARVQQETGATFIHPYNDPRIIAGQGTAALELLDDVPDLDAIIAPVGGGGLMSGSCLAARGINETIRLFAAEPAGADDAARSMKENRIVPMPNPQTIADGLRTSLGDLTYTILHEHLEDVITVSEDEIIEAMRLAWTRAKLLIEPSSAVALAAVLSEKFRSLEGVNRVGIILSGGNVDVDHLPW